MRASSQDSVRRTVIAAELSYALSKVLGEEMARQFNRRFGTPIVGLRFSNIMEPQDYAAFPGYQKDARLRKWNFWGYIDARVLGYAPKWSWRNQR